MSAGPRCAHGDALAGLERRVTAAVLLIGAVCAEARALRQRHDSAGGDRAIRGRVVGQRHPDDQGCRVQQRARGGRGGADGASRRAVVLLRASALRSPRRHRVCAVRAGGVRRAGRPPSAQIELRAGKQLLKLVLNVVRLAARRQLQIRARKRSGVDRREAASRQAAAVQLARVRC
jgi:hypothetical protein